MRYANWDVLLFPDGSKAPLQEFKTGCYVVQDPDLFLPELARKRFLLLQDMQDRLTG